MTAESLSGAEQRAASIRLMRESVARQRAAARAQAPRSRWFEAPPLVQADCEPISAAESDPIIAASGEELRLDPDLLRAVIRQESGFRPCAVSPRGAMGLMQLMPDTASDLGVADPFDPHQNIRAGARYLRLLLDQFNDDIPQALSAYNAGPGKVKDGSASDIQETEDYVERILKDWKGSLQAPAKRLR